MQTDVIFYMCTWRRNLPLSIVISVSAITVLYVFTNFSYFVVLGIGGVLQSEAVAMVCLLCMHVNYFNPSVSLFIIDMFTECCHYSFKG